MPDLPTCLRITLSTGPELIWECHRAEIGMSEGAIVSIVIFETPTSEGTHIRIPEQSIITSIDFLPLGITPIGDESLQTLKGE